MMKRSPSLRILFILSVVYFSPKSPARAATDLEPIVVKGRSYGGEGQGVATAVITKEEIAKIPANSPEDILDYLGVDVQTRGPYGVKSDVSLNASTFQQVLILVNGIRVNDSQTAHQDLDLFFNIDDIERIEIIPAAASAKYGPDGIGGAINFILKKPAKEKNSVSAAGGNHQTSEEKLNFSYGALKSNNRLSLTHAQSNGSRYDTDYNTYTVFHSTAIEGENASLFVDAGYNQKAFGAFDFYTPGLGFPSKEWINTKFIDARSVLKNTWLTFEPRLSYRQHHDKFMLDITNPGFALNHHTTNTFEAGGRVSAPWQGHDLAGGADYGEEHIVSDNLGKHVRGHWDAYLDPTFNLSPASSLNLTLRTDDYTTFGEEFTGSVLFKHTLSDNSDIYATLGRTMRIPTFTELYYSDPTTAGNTDLKPEHAYNLEAGWNKELLANLDFSFSFFVRHELDTIDFTKLTTADPKFIARNISQATTHGLNAYLKWKASDKTSLDLRYYFGNKRLKTRGMIFKYGLNYAKHMIDLGMDNAFSFGHNRVDILMKKKPGRRAWTLVNDTFSWPVRKDLEVFFEVYNLFNVEYQEIAGIPEQSRLFKLGTKFTW